MLRDKSTAFTLPRLCFLRFLVFQHQPNFVNELLFFLVAVVQHAHALRYGTERRRGIKGTKHRAGSKCRRCKVDGDEKSVAPRG